MTLKDQLNEKKSALIALKERIEAEELAAEQARLEAEAARADSIYRAEHPELAEPATETLAEGTPIDSLSLRSAEVAYYGEQLASALAAPTESYTLENDFLKLK